ncbi:MAG: hypothetical protein LBB54_01425, partial [Cellulomonadaceae bacterium]|nr:hypothetical protein [Cellulomonadaceae bacterium]
MEASEVLTKIKTLAGLSVTWRTFAGGLLIALITVVIGTLIDAFSLYILAYAFLGLAQLLMFAFILLVAHVSRKYPFQSFIASIITFAYLVFALIAFNPGLLMFRPAWRQGVRGSLFPNQIYDLFGGFWDRGEIG